MKKTISILFATLLCVALQAQAKYVFYFIGDGMGLNQIRLTEMYREACGKEPLCFTSFPVASYATNPSSDSDVTDSAASGTALACGVKTVNGRLGMDADGNVVASLAELAKAKGHRVGIITNVPVNHATPAAFSAHQEKRSYEYEIAMDQIACGFDFYGGDGFHKDKKDKRGEKVKSAKALFKEAGYTVCNYEEWRNNSEDISKVLMVPGKGQSIDYAIDMNREEPSQTLRLDQQTEAAIELLSRGRSKGFFLMVEGGRIDYACHSHDAATTIAEIDEFDRAIRLALTFYEKHRNETLIVVAADHETGSLALKPEDKNAFRMLDRQKYSKNHITAELRRMLKEDEDVSWEQMRAFLSENFGFWDGIELKEEDEKRLKDIYDRTVARNESGSVTDLYSDNAVIVSVAAEILNRYCEIYWNGGHSSSYIPVFAIGKGAALFSARSDNALIPMNIRKAAQY